MPRYDLLMLVPFSSLERAGEAVAAIFRAGFTPSALELIEEDALRITADYLDTALHVPEDIEAHLLIEVDGNDQAMLMKDMEAIAGLLGEYGAGDDVLLAEDAAQKAELWKVRRRVAEAVKLRGYTIEEDTVVPRAELPALIRGVKALGKEYGFHAVCYGHAGDGNLHIRIRKEGSLNSQEDPAIVESLRALFRLVHRLGGTISGEHGIGLVQKGYLDIVFGEVQMQLMRGIKAVFDPNGIMNAGKIFDKST